jgi:hypothetical protein
MRDGRVAQPFLNRIYLAPIRQSGDQAEAAAFRMLAALLGGSSQTSVLERTLTHDQGISLSAWAGYNGTARDHGTFSLGLTPAPGTTLEEAEEALDAVLAEFIEDGVDAEQFERVQMQVRAAAIYELDDAVRPRPRDRRRPLGRADAGGFAGLDRGAAAGDAREVIAAAHALDRRASVTGWLMGEEDDAAPRPPCGGAFRRDAAACRDRHPARHLRAGVRGLAGRGTLDPLRRHRGDLPRRRGARRRRDARRHLADDRASVEGAGDLDAQAFAAALEATAGSIRFDAGRDSVSLRSAR